MYKSVVRIPKKLKNAGSKLLPERLVLKLSAPDILQRPAPQPGAVLFGAPRPERPSAPANPGHCPRAPGKATRAVHGQTSRQAY